MTLRLDCSAERERRAVLIAVVAHAAALFAFRMHPIAQGVAPEASPDARAAPELYLDLAATDVPVPGAVSPTEPRSVHPSAGTTAATPGAKAALSHELAPAVADSPGGAWTPPRPASSIDLSLGADRYRAFVPPAASRVSEATGNDLAPRIFGALSEHDRELGLGLGGPIESAVVDVVRQESMLGVALFDVTVDHGGGVRVDLVPVPGDSAPWEALRGPIAQLVAARPVRLPERSAGLRVRVRVEAREKLADGRDVRTLGNGVHATVGVPGTESVAMKELPSVGIEHRGKVCSGRLALGPNGGDLAATTNFGVDGVGGGGGALPSLLTPLTVGGGCSVENIGAPSRRMVAARVVEETRL